MSAASDSYNPVVPPVYIGVSFLLSWVYLLFYARSAGIEAAAPISLMSFGYTLSAVLMVMTLLVVAFFVKKRVRFLTSVPVKAFAGVVLPTGTAVLVAGGYLQLPALLCLGGVLTGVASGIQTLQWIVAYKRVGLNAAISSFPLLLAVSVGTCMTLMYLPGIVLVFATVVLPVVSEVMFHAVRHSIMPEYSLDPGPRDMPINFVVLLAPIAVYALCSGFLDFFSGYGLYTFVFYACISFIPLVTAGIYAYLVERRRFLSVFVVPACFLIVAFVPFLTLMNVTPLAQFVSIGELGVEILLFIVSVGFANYFSIDSLKTYSLARMLNFAMNTAGWYAARGLSRSFEGLYDAQAALLVGFLAVEVASVGLTIAIVKARKSTLVDEGGEDAAEGAAAVAAVVTDPAKQEPLQEGWAEALNRCCGEIAEEFDLSKREVDVLKLLAQGNSSQHIQEALFIAAGTVNYHTRNIYAKLGVHSKQQVIDLVRERMGKG